MLQPDVVAYNCFMSAIPPSQPAEELLLEYSSPKKKDRILILEGGDGWLASEVAKYVPDGFVTTHDRDIRNLKNAKNNLRTFNNAKTGLGALPENNEWDLVLLIIPKERSFARYLLIASFFSLKKGGRFLLAGPSRQGAKAVIKDAQRLFGNATILGYRSHQRVAFCQKQSEASIPLPKEFLVPGIAPGSTYNLTVDLPYGSLQLSTSPGIFSWKKIDQGSALLLEHMDIDSNSIVWDVGCGYGILGLAAALRGAKQVLMSDINTLAVDYAQKNAVSNNLSKNVLIFAANGLKLPSSISAPPHVDLVLSNPAFHQGRHVDKSMAEQVIRESTSFLQPGGRLLLVANRFLPYEKSMQSHFRYSTTITKNNQYHVIEGRV